MSKLLLGTICGIIYGGLSVVSMIPLTFSDKKAALIGAFLNRFAIGFVIGAAKLPVPGWLQGLIFGILLSLPDAIITKDILTFFVPFLFRELNAVKPALIISLGNTPTHALLQTRKPISALRGEFQSFNGIKVMPTYNPAYLLRDPSRKREAWEDLKKVRAVIQSSLDPNSQRV